MDFLFMAAIVKGLIDHEDGTYHFGSLGAYNFHLQATKSAGLVEPDGVTVTKKGQAWYHLCLKTIESKEKRSRRCTYWDHSRIVDPASV